MAFNTELMPYQEEGVTLAHEQFGDRCLIADEMGLGKTIQSLYWWAMYHRFKPGKLVVVCPPIVKYNWQNEIRKHLGFGSYVIEGTLPPKNTEHLERHKIFIMGYPSIGGKRGRTWCRVLRKMGIYTVIIDECHNIKTPTAQRSKNTVNLCRKVPKLMALSGTPVLSFPIELFVTLNLLKPKVWDSFREYAFNYCAPKMTGWGWTYRGATNLEHLHDMLAKHVMIRRKKADVLEQLPDKITTVFPVNITNRKEYKEAEDNLILWLAKTSPQRAKKASKVERLVRFGYLLRIAAKLKTKAIKEWLVEFLEEYPDEKVIAFGKHKFLVRALKEDPLFNNVSCIIDGAVTGRERQEAVDDFNNNKKKRIMFANIIAAGAGWNGQAASNILMMEYDWTPGALDQAIARAHRIGQKSVVNVFFPVGKDTIEERLLALLQGKASNVNAILDGGKSGDVFNAFDLLSEVLLEDNRPSAFKRKKRR